LDVVRTYLRNTENKHPLFVGNRSKQWLVFLQMHYPQASDLFHLIKKEKDAAAVFSILDAQFSSL